MTLSDQLMPSVVKAPHAGGFVVDHALLAVKQETDRIDGARGYDLVPCGEASPVKLGFQGGERLAPILLVPTVQDGVVHIRRQRRSTGT